MQVLGMDLYARLKARLVNQLPMEREFMGHIHTIKKLLSDGHTGKAIWSALRAEESLSCSYRQFCRYMHRHVAGGDG